MNLWTRIAADGFDNEHEWAYACPCQACEVRWAHPERAEHREVRRFSFDPKPGVVEEVSLGGNATPYDWHVTLTTQADGLWTMVIRKRCPEGDEPDSWETFAPRTARPGAITRFLMRDWARFFVVGDRCRVDLVYLSELGAPVMGYDMPRGEVEAAMRDLRALVAEQIREARAAKRAEDNGPGTDELRREAWQNYMIGEGYC